MDLGITLIDGIERFFTRPEKQAPGDGDSSKPGANSPNETNDWEESGNEEHFYHCLHILERTARTTSGRE